MSEAAIRKLEDNLAFRYIADSDRPTNVESIEKALLRNQKRAIKELHELHGAIGPNPAYDESGDLIVDTGYAPDLALTPFLSKKSLANIPKALSKVKDAAKFVKKHGVSTAWEQLGTELVKRSRAADPNRINKSTKAYLATNKTIRDIKTLTESLGKLAIRDKNWKTDIVKLVPRLPDKLKKWATSTEASEDILSAAKYGKSGAIKDIGSLKGFDRFLNTVGWDGVSQKNYMPMYKLYRNLMRHTIESADIQQMSPLEKFLDPKTRGWARRGSTASVSKFEPGTGHVFSDVQKPPIISLRPNPKMGKGRPKELIESTAVHEATHIGQLQKKRGWKELEALADQYDLPHSDLKLFASKFWGRLGLKGNDPSWEMSYLNKIDKHLWPDNKGPMRFESLKITDPNVGITAQKGTHKEWIQYALQPKEISARMSQIRNLRNKKQLTSIEKRALKNLEETESQFFSKEGIDYAVDKLWMAAPAIPVGLDEDLFKEVKE